MFVLLPVDYGNFFLISCCSSGPFLCGEPTCTVLSGSSFSLPAPPSVGFWLSNSFTSSSSALLSGRCGLYRGFCFDDGLRTPFLFGRKSCETGFFDINLLRLNLIPLGFLPMGFLVRSLDLSVTVLGSGPVDSLSLLSVISCGSSIGFFCGKSSCILGGSSLPLSTSIGFRLSDAFGSLASELKYFTASDTASYKFPYDVLTAKATNNVIDRSLILKATRTVDTAIATD